MNFPSAEQLPQFILTAIPLLLSLTVHEFAHARVALAFGDRTALLMGRVSLNPLRHLDPIGTLALLFTNIIGWAKPVPVNTANLHPRRLGDICVSAAGPLSNLALAAISVVALRLAIGFHELLSPVFFKSLILLLGVMISANVCLFLFNLLPLFPLDGHHIMRELLPLHLQLPFMRWQVKYGRIAMMVLIFGPLLYTTVTRLEVPFNPLFWVNDKVVTSLLVMVGLAA